MDFSKTPTVWNGYNLFAIDDMNLSLPSTSETQNEFGVLQRASKDRVSPKISVIYDISNDLIVQAHIGTVKIDADERTHAKELILSPVLERRGTEKCIIIFDLGYLGRDLIYKLTEKKFSFLMRCSKSFLKEVNQASIGDTFIVDEYKGVSTHLLVLKFPLDSGELKNRILIEHFTSKKVNGIKQEFYVHLLISNIAALLKNIRDQKINEIQKNKNLKYKYQTNKSYLLGILAKKM